jgi:hypothetical protein
MITPQPDHVLLLSEKWRITADSRQWIVEQMVSEMVHRKGRMPKAEWRQRSFVATTKTVLLRVLEEGGAVITDEGHKALTKLPDTFQEWRKAN